jgi:hypothetical protein
MDKGAEKTAPFFSDIDNILCVIKESVIESHKMLR